MVLLFWCVVSPQFVHDNSKTTSGEKIMAPKLLHGLLAAGTDIWVLELSRKALGKRYLPATVSTPCLPLIILVFNVLQFFLSLTSFFHALSLSRSMSNSLETTLTTIALCYYPWGTSILPSRYAGYTDPMFWEEIISHVDHSSVDSCWSLPSPAQSASPAP